jgi:quercetin dioxygenase-like cupin family protein
VENKDWVEKPDKSRGVKRGLPLKSGISKGDDMPDIYFADTKSKAVFSAEGPKPQFLIDTPQFKALVVGLEAGGQIPVHPGEAAMYHFLEGEGLMTVDDESFAIKPGVTVVVPSGAKRGMNAKTRLVFLGSKGEK